MVKGLTLKSREVMTRALDTSARAPFRATRVSPAWGEDQSYDQEDRG